MIAANSNEVTTQMFRKFNDFILLFLCSRVYRACSVLINLNIKDGARQICGHCATLQLPLLLLLLRFRKDQQWILYNHFGKCQQPVCWLFDVVPESIALWAQRSKWVTLELAVAWAHCGRSKARKTFTFVLRSLAWNEKRNTTTTITEINNRQGS